MRLLRREDGGGLSLVEFVGKNIPRYAVLSHTWGADHEEVTFKDLMENKGHGGDKAGYKKIHFCTAQAARDGLQFSWVDTCCIDKSSSAELSEAINSMFRWYHDAAKCYVYLPDVSFSTPAGTSILPQEIRVSLLQHSRWFTRGWTLQELIAPTSLEFFSVEGNRLGDKYSMVQELHEITGISVGALQGNTLSEFSVDERMSWAAGRETKREEDAAYSLLGIFDVHIPLIYGEGRRKALNRLQREVREALRDESPSDYDSPQYQPLQKPREGKNAGLTSPKRPGAEEPVNFSDFSVIEAELQRIRQEKVEQETSRLDITRSISGPPTPDLHRPVSVYSDWEEDMAEANVPHRIRLRTPAGPPIISRRRRSLEVLDFENKIKELEVENKRLVDLKTEVERNLRASTLTLAENDVEIDSLKRSLDNSRHEVTRLTEVAEELKSLSRHYSDRCAMLETQLAQATRELTEARNTPAHLSSGIEEIVRDEDYFENAFQELCQRMQEWVLRFSKSSDTRACRLTSEITDGKIITLLDNAILDGSDVDIFLADRVKRRDIFMSVTATMVWEYIFTRYLFGIDHRQREDFRSLEKILMNVGTPATIRSWRATTLTLMSKLEDVQRQREQDTQSVVRAVCAILYDILPPPRNLEVKIEEQLAKLIQFAVNLSIEMRCQRVEYMVLPPLLPEYDGNGDLISKVTFNAAIMNERSGKTTSNEALESEKSVVRIVLFPLVVRKGDDNGEGDDEVVVCPAQVLCR